MHLENVNDREIKQNGMAKRIIPVNIRFTA